MKRYEITFWVNKPHSPFQGVIMAKSYAQAIKKAEKILIDFQKATKIEVEVN